MTPATLVRPRNDLAQYDDLAASWDDPFGPLAALHGLAAERATLVPVAPAGGTLVDLGCGGGLLAPHVRGYRHLGVDLNEQALAIAAAKGVEPVRADVTAVPLPDGAADVVVAGELLEHVEDLDGCVRECARLLRPGGTFVWDTLAAGPFARVALVHVAERLPGGPPPQIHDPRLLVDPRRLRALLDRHGIEVTEMHGLRPALRSYARWLRARAGDRDPAAAPFGFVRTRSLAGVYAGTGTRR